MIGISLDIPEVAARRGAFSPASLFAGSTGGWWDPSDHTTTFQDTAGTVPADTAGQSVARINDKSGNGHNLTQVTGASQPTLQNTGSLWYLAFNGTSQSIFGTFTFVQPITIVGAVNNVAFISNGRIWDGFSGNAAGLFQTGATTVQMFAGSAGPSDATLTTNVNHVVNNFFSGTSSTMQVDNGTVDTGSAGTASPSGVTIGAFGQGASSWSNMQFYGGIWIGRSLAAGEVNACRTFFGAKAGLSL